MSKQPNALPIHRVSSSFRRGAYHLLIAVILNAGILYHAAEDTKSNSQATPASDPERKREITRTPERKPPPEVLKGPTVILRTSEQRTVYEFRVNGRLTRIKVIPKNGRPYYLIPSNRSQHMGDFRQNARLERVWEIATF